ncbi:lipase family protein [Nocardia stercoris]|uniref:Lipase n=1 Tax=Nocardia stercoris TaxID=2483361 RepID=A0A3M2KS85_9NOCA|nr:lipase family protein [Nocardia stercoris]RMI27854.1 lipase [Nocardia stercoris]
MRGARVPKPGDDEFYSAPDGFEKLATGAVIRVRPVRIGLFGVIPQRVSAWQLLYRTQDLDGRPEVAVTTVLAPHGARPWGRPLLSFQCAIDAVAPQCLPSYALRQGARVIGALPQLELPQIGAALERGWLVSVPDHGGTAGRFGVPREPGYRALDAVRATIGHLGLDESNPVALGGYSGGGLATVWAAEVAGDYAPELNLVGAVAGSPVGDPGATLVRLQGTVFAGFPAVFVAGLCKAYPELDRRVRAGLSPEYAARLDRAARLATLPLLARFARSDVDRHITGGLRAFLATPQVATVIDDIRPGVVAPKLPLLVFQAVHDEVIDERDIAGLVDRYRAGGADVDYLRDRLGLHTPLQFAGTPLLLDWLADRLTGQQIAGHTRTVVSIGFDRRTARGQRRFAATVGRMLTGRPLRDRGTAAAPARIRRLRSRPVAS